MKKYLVQKRVGVPLTIAGGAVAAAGAIITVLSPLGGLTEGGSTEPVNRRVLNGLMIGGGAVLAAGAGLLISSKKNYRKALKIAPLLGLILYGCPAITGSGKQ